MRTQGCAKRTERDFRCLICRSAIGQGGPLSKSAYYCFNMLFEATTKAADQ